MNLTAWKELSGKGNEYPRRYDVRLKKLRIATRSETKKIMTKENKTSDERKDPFSDTTQLDVKLS